MSIKDSSLYNKNIQEDLQKLLKMTGRESCVVFDTETTSLSPDTGDIWEIGGYIVTKNNVKEFHKYIKTSKTLEELASLEGEERLMYVGGRNISKAKFFYGGSSHDEAAGVRTLAEMMGYEDPRDQDDIYDDRLISRDELIAAVPELANVGGNTLFIGANVGFDVRFLNRLISSGHKITQENMLDSQALLFDVLPNITSIDLSGLSRKEEG